MSKTKWYFRRHCERSVAILLALTLMLSLGIVALPMAGTVEADEGMIYAITDLGHLGGDYSQAQDINNLGQVVGSTKVADGSYTTFRWSESGGMIDLGTFGGSYKNFARGINGSGQVVGESTKADGKSRAFIYDGDNGMRDINDLLPGGSGWILTKAYDINDAGQVVGEGIISGATHAFLWSESEGVTDLGTLSGYSDSTARGINNSGQVVGWSGTKGEPTPTQPIWQVSHAFLWSESGGMTSLGDLGGDWSQAHAINNPAQVVGQSTNTGGDCHAFLWSESGGMTDLGPPGGWSYAYDINSSAQIVGKMKPADGSYTVFLYDSTNGMQDINGLIPEGTGWTLDIAYGINDASQIVGSMSDESYTTHAYLLTSRSRPEEVWVDGGWDGTTLGTEVETGKIFGFNAFAAIQGGIDNVAAAGTVNVAEGTYNENVNVEVEHLTIQSLDGAASTTLTAPIKSDYVFDIEADSVTIDGFTFGNFALGVRVNANNCIIKNNVVSGSTGAYVVPLVDEDFEGGTLPTDWERTSNGAGWLIGIGEDFFFFPLHTTYAASNDYAAGAGNDGSVDYLITPPLDLSGCSSADLSFQSCYSSMFGQQLAYVEISEDGGSSWEELKQITADPDWTQVDVDLSTYCGTGHNSVLVAFHADDGGGDFATGWAIDDVLITTPPNMPVDGAIIVNGNSNTIQGNTISSNGCPGIYLEGSSTDNEIHFNNIEGNTDYGINNTASSIVDATNNWWGSASGPTHESNTYTVPAGEAQGDAVSDLVDFVPWLDAAYPGGTGFAPVENTDTGEQFSSIQAAIDDAATVAGDTINVAAGTYVEAVKIDKTLNLRGESGATIRPDNTTLTHDGSRRAAIYFNTVDNVTIESFIIDGTGGDVHSGICGVFSKNLTIRNNTIHDIKNTIGAPAYDCGGVGITLWSCGSDKKITGCLIEGNTVYNTGRLGIFIGTMDSTCTNWLLSEDNIIRNNTVHHAYQGPTNDTMCGGICMDGALNCTIEGNTTYSNGTGTILMPGIYMNGLAGSNLITGNDTYDNNIGILVYTNRPEVDFEGQTPAPPKVQFNNIYGNTSYGLYVKDTEPYEVDAINNWWGDASGPYDPDGTTEVPPCTDDPATEKNEDGTGDKVSDNVDYCPWTGAEIVETDSGTGVDAYAQTTNASAQATGGDTSTTVTVAEYAGEPTGVDPGFAVDGTNFVDVQVSGPLPNQLIIEIKCPGEDCSGMVMRWFDGTTWQNVSPQEVTNGTIKAILNTDTTPRISELTGSPFGVGSPPPPPPVGGEAYPVNKLAILAPWIAIGMAIIAATTVILRRRRAQG